MTKITFQIWLASIGGIKPLDKTLKGELRDIRFQLKRGRKYPAQGIYPMIWKTSQTLGSDDIVYQAIESEWMPEESDESDLIDWIVSNPTSKIYECEDDDWPMEAETFYKQSMED
ncbi:MAG: hypothetical protein GY861_24210 [bacterium]|nr:hypothetical protein [bacterium]